MIKRICIAIVVTFCLSCTNEVGKSKNGKYIEMSKLLNDCSCYAVVVATGVNEGYLTAYKNFILIKDSKGKVFTYQGTHYNVTKGDTLVRKTNCN